MFDVVLRQWKDSLADPVARHIPLWISPTHITGAAFLAGLLACFTASGPASKVFAVSFWVVNRFLDLLSDFIIYSILPIAIAYGQDNGLYDVDWISVAMLEATFHVNNFILFYSAAVAAQKDDQELTSVTMRPALIEGFESGLLFTAMLLWPQYINSWARIMSAGVVIGIFQRALAVVRVLRSKINGQKLQ
jgi:hypothetical protein